MNIRIELNPRANSRVRRRRMHTVLLVLLSGIALPVSAGPPSFLCTQARTWVEQTICADAALSDLDLILATDYARLLASAPADEARKIIADRNTWWTSRNDCRKSTAPIACLSALYDERIIVLQTHPDFPAAMPAPHVEVSESNVREGASGWAKGLSDYMKAIHACLPLMPIETEAIGNAWSEQDGQEIVVRLLGTNEETWVCVARRDGTKVITLREQFAEEKLPEAGPYFYVGSVAPRGKCKPVKVLDPNDKVAGWLAGQRCGN